MVKFMICCYILPLEMSPSGVNDSWRLTYLEIRKPSDEIDPRYHYFLTGLCLGNININISGGLILVKVARLSFSTIDFIDILC